MGHWQEGHMLWANSTSVSSAITENSVPIGAPLAFWGMGPSLNPAQRVKRLGARGGNNRKKAMEVHAGRRRIV